jgi:hypothetical protein
MMVGLRARAREAPVFAKTNVLFEEGVHYWEVNCPLYCRQLSKYHSIFEPARSARWPFLVVTYSLRGWASSRFAVAGGSVVRQWRRSASPSFEKPANLKL